MSLCMLELDHKEGWAPKNWCFWTVVLKKSLESLLDSKGIKPVNPKGNQSWIFIGRTDAEAEAPMLWPPDLNSWLTGKDPDVGKDWGQEEKGATVDEMVGWHHRLNGHEFEQTLGVSEGKGRLAGTVHGVANSWIWLTDWTLCWISAAPISRPPYWQANTCDFSQLQPFREVYSGTSLSAFPWSYEVRHIFMYLLIILISHFEKYPIESFAHFSAGLSFK